MSKNIPNLSHSVTDAGNPHVYFTQIPNIVYDLGLTVYEQALYGTLKRVCGANGNRPCKLDSKELARLSGMSQGMVPKAKDGLLRKRSELGGKALIKITPRPRAAGQKPGHDITLTNIWDANMRCFLAQSGRSPDEHGGPKTHSPHEHEGSNSHSPHEPSPQNDVHDMNVAHSPHEIRKNSKDCNILSGGGDNESFEKLPPEQTPPPREKIDLEEPVAKTLRQVCQGLGGRPKFWASKDKQLFREVYCELLTFFDGDPVKIAAALWQRFTSPTWNKSTAPLLSQILPMWDAQGVRAEKVERAAQPTAPRPDAATDAVLEGYRLKQEEVDRERASGKVTRWGRYGEKAQGPRAKGAEVVAQ